MNFWTLNGLGHRLHGLLLLSGCGLFLSAFSVACFTDLNHPPGVRNVRLGALLFILTIAAIEFLWAWRGVALFALLWPLQLPIKLVLTRDVSRHFSAVPDIFDWPLASSLVIAVAVRQLRTIPPDPLRIKENRVGNLIKFLPLFLYVFSTIVIFSSVSGYLSLRSAPSEWNVHPMDFRRILFVHNPASVLRPIWVGIPLITNALFGIAMLRALVFEKNKNKASHWPQIAFLGSMTAAAVLVILQIRGEWFWREIDDGPPGGPFSNRNMVSPMLILAATSSWTLRHHVKSLHCRAAFVVLGIALTIVGFITGSRNGALMTLAIPWLYLWYYLRSIYAAGISACATALLLVIVFLVPIPAEKHTDFHTDLQPKQRGIETIRNIRNGEWESVTGYRNELWRTAFDVAKIHPLLGGGPGTFYLYVSQVPETKNDVVKKPGIAFIAAHSTPVNLLSDCGVMVVILWFLIWIVTPIANLRRANIPAASIGLILLGLGNIFDTPWLSSGAMSIFYFFLASHGEMFIGCASPATENLT